jgi:AcrR family transcriptional regulator
MAATRCISRLGFSKSTMEEIALEAGVTRVTIYREFGNRKALMEALSARRLSAFNKGFLADSPRFETVPAALEAYLLASTRAARENPITREIVRGSLSFTRTGSPLHTLMRAMWEPLIRSTNSGVETIAPSDIDGAVEWIMVTQHTLSRLVIETGLSEESVRRVVRTYIAPAFVRAD